MTRTCFDCTHSSIHSGSPATYWDPGEAPEATCNLLETTTSEILADWLGNEVESLDPEHCGCFLPRMAGRCSVCGVFVKTPLAVHPFVIEDQIQCSAGCHELAHSARQTEIEAEIAMERAINEALPWL